MIHSYRVRYGYVAGDPALAAIEAKLAAKPPIAVPTIVLQGEAPGTVPPEASIAHAKYFTGPVPAPHAPARRPQRAAGGAARDRRRP